MSFARAWLICMILCWMSASTLLAQDDLELEDLLNDIAEEAINGDDAGGDAADFGDDELDDLLGDLEETADETVDTAGEAMDEGLDELGLDDLFDDTAGGAEPDASATTDAELDDLLGDLDAEVADETADAAADELDELGLDDMFDDSAEAVADAATDAVEDVADAATDELDELGLDDILGDSEADSTDMTEELADAVDELEEATEELADASEAMEEATGDMMDAAEDAADDVMDDMAADAGGDLEDLFGDLDDEAAGAIDAADAAVADAGDTATDMMDDAVAEELDELGLDDMIEDVDAASADVADAAATVEDVADEMSADVGGDLDDLMADADAELDMAAEAVEDADAALEDLEEVGIDDLLADDVQEPSVAAPAEPDVDVVAEDASADMDMADADFDLDDILGDDGDDAAPMDDDMGMADVEESFGGFDDAAMDVEPEPVVEETIEPAIVEVAEVDEDDEPAMEEADATELAKEVTAAEIIRRRANEIEGTRLVDEGNAALAAEDYEAALGRFEGALRLIQARPGNEEVIKRANWGISEANYNLAANAYKTGDRDVAEQLVAAALERTPNHRAAVRLQQKIGKAKTQPTRFDAAKQPDVIAEKAQVRDLLIEGREFYSVGEYDLAEQRFDQVRLLDPYNTDALEFLKKLGDRRYKISTIERDKTVADMMNEVRKRWNPPIEKDINLDDSQGGSQTEVPIRPETEIEKKMRELVIPIFEVRDANVVDVLEKLRKQSQDIDPEGLGINMVVKLDGAGGGTVTPSLDAAEPATEPFEDPFGGGDAGFDDPFAEDAGGFDDPVDDFDSGGGDFGGGAQTVTLNLRRVSLMDALQIITEVANLQFRIDKGVVFISPKGSVDRPMETRIYAVNPSFVDVIVTREDDTNEQRDEFVEIGSATTMTRRDVKKYFEDLGIPFPPGASVTFNASSSQLIVRNAVENLEVLERLLPKINRPPPQVEIEARFVEVRQTDLEELGLEWILTDDYEFAERVNGAPIGAREVLQIDADTDGFTKGLRFFGNDAAGIQGLSRTDAITSGGFVGDVASFSSVLTNPELNLVLHALNQKGATDLLSAPRVTTRSGVSASIEVVTEIIYPTEFTAESGTDNDIDIDTPISGDVTIASAFAIFPETFETREIGVILNVTPTVGADGFTIDLTMAPEVAELIGWIQYGTPPFNIPQPIFASRNVTTSIVVWDGQTVVLGGLIREELDTIDDRIPVLGDLPLLGRFFRNEAERSVKRNLLIFVTARVVDPAGRPVRAGEETFLPGATISTSDADGELATP